MSKSAAFLKLIFVVIIPFFFCCYMHYLPHPDKTRFHCKDRLNHNRRPPLQSQKIEEFQTKDQNHDIQLPNDKND